MTDIAHLTRTNDFVRKFEHLHNQGCYAEGVALPSEPLEARQRGIPLEATEADLRAGAVCGTSFCFGGWAALLAGWHQCRDNEAWVVDETGREASMYEAGREALGLTAGQAAKLFDGLNDLELLDRYVAHLVAHPDADGDALREVEEDYIYDH